MGNLNCKAMHAAATRDADQTVHYGYAHSVAHSRQSLPPVLQDFKQLEADRLIPTQVSQQPEPRILSVACGYGEDVPLYRQAFGEGCRINAIDVHPKFTKVAAAEQAQGRQTHFSLADAAHLPFAPDFDLIMMRHPEPSSDQRVWMEIFVEVALFAQKSKAALIITAFSQHERDYFIQLADLMKGQGVSLVKAYVNQSIAPKVDALGAAYAHDRYVAVFKPSVPNALQPTPGSVTLCNDGVPDET